MTTHHELKTWSVLYPAVASGAKTVELRCNDRDFAEGDELLLREWDPIAECYTGRSCVRRVTHIVQGGQWGLERGTVALSIAEVTDWRRIAVQVARFGGSYHGLTTAERDTLEAEIRELDEMDAERVRDWTNDAATGLEGR